MINKTIIGGRFTKDPKLMTTTNGISTLRATIAVERDFKDKEGNRQTDFISVVFWKKTAETVAKYFRKGSRILCEGRIQTGSYQNKEGKTVYTTDVYCDRFSFVDSKQENEARGIQNGNSQPVNATSPQPQVQYQQPVQQQQQLVAAANDGNWVPQEDGNICASAGEAPFPISDEDLPF